MEKSGNFEIISLFCNPEIVENLKSEDEVIDTSTAENAEEEEYLVSVRLFVIMRLLMVACDLI